jgi:pimeloyl-ACP methyl ester carboxylesterase
MIGHGGDASSSPRTQPPPDHGVRSVPDRKVIELPGGRTVSYVDQGAGPAVVLIHGTLSLLDDMWLSLAPLLRPDYRVVALDRPGHGGSLRKRIVDASPWQQAEIIHDALRRLGVVNPIVVGHSYGGTVALCYALAHPAETAGVVALAPLCFPELRLELMLFGPRAVPLLGDQWSQVLAASVDPLLLPVLWRSNFLPQAMPDRFGAQFPFAWAALSTYLCNEGEDALAAGPALALAAAAYASCTVPTRILGGTADLVVNNAVNGCRAAMLLPAGTFHWLPGVGHMLHHAEPGAVIAAVRGLTP